MSTPLHIVFDAPTAPAASRTGGTNHPELRQQLILAALSKQTAFAVTTQANETSADVDAIAAVHFRPFVTFLRESFDDARASQDKDWYSAAGESLLPYTIYTDGLNGIDTHLARQRYYKQAGLFAKDLMTPILSHTWTQASRSAQNTILAAQYLQSHREAVVYACNSAPGHHASFARYAGYCFINNIALAAVTLLHDPTVKKIGILDVDYHAGDGTQAIFYKRDDVVTVSIHGNPALDYPSFAGFSDEVGEGAGVGSNYNFPMPAAATWAEYMPVLAAALATLQSKGIQYLLVAFGADTHESDPDPSNVAGMRLKYNDYVDMGKQIRAAFPHLPILVTQEGGYFMDGVGEIVKNFLAGLCVQ